MVAFAKGAGEHVERLAGLHEHGIRRDRGAVAGHDRQQDGGEHPEQLRGDDDAAAVEAIGHLPRRERKKDHRQRRRQPHQPQRGGRLRAPVQFVLHRDHQHLPADHRGEIAQRIQPETGASEGGVSVQAGMNGWRWMD